MSTIAKTTVSDAAPVSIFETINKFSVSDKFIGTMAVDVFKIKKYITVAYASGHFAKSIRLDGDDVTLEAFADAIIALATEAQEDIKESYVTNGGELILKIASKRAAREKMKSDLANANKDFHAAVEFKETVFAEQRAKEAKIAELTAQLAELTA